MSDDDGQEPYAWAKLHAYGFVLAVLTILAMADLISPADTDLARIAGEVPPGQAWWTIGYGLSGILMLFAFLRVDRIAETIGLALLCGAILAQTVTAISLLGWTEFTLTRLAIVGIVGACTWARCSVLWSREGVAVTIPPRKVKGRR